MYIISPICGFISLFLGIIVLFGWYTHSTTLIQVHASFVPMQYNTALGFLMCGAGLLSAYFSKSKAAKISGLLLILLGGLTLIEYVFGVDLSIDQLFMEHYVGVKTSHPGRMAPNTALCFLLVGVSLVIASQFYNLKKCAKVLGFLGALIFALGTVPFFGYLTGVETAYGWGNLTRMAVHTSFGFITLGIGIVVYAWKIEIGHQKGIPGWLPILVGIAALNTTVLLWQAISKDTNRNMYTLIQQKGDQVKVEILSELEGRIKGLHRIVRRWEIGGPPSKEEWQSESSLYVEHHLSMIRIGLIDPEFKNAWIAPLNGNEGLIGRDHSLDKGFNKLLSRSRDERILMVSRILDTEKDKRIFGAVLPVYHAGKFLGFMAGVFKVENLIEGLLEEGLVDGIKVGFLNKSVSDATTDIKKTKWQVIVPLQFYEHNWSMVVEADPDWVESHTSTIPIVVLLFGIFVSLILTWAVHLALRSRFLADETKRAHEALKDAHGDLELRVEERTKELRSSQEMTRAVIETALDGMIIIDDKGNIKSFNPAAENIFGYLEEEVLDKNLKFLMPEPYNSEHDGYISNYINTRIAKIIGVAREVEGLRIDKTVFPIELCVTQVWIKDKLHFSGVIRDITIRKEAENKIIQAREAAERANQAKSIFISSMSHEIRTPMNAILGYSQILERDKELNSKQKKGIESIHRAGKHLLDIINDILDFSKIEAGKLELHPHDFDLGSLVQDLIVIFSGKCKEKKLELRSEGVQEGQKIYVHSEAAKLRQVLVNLVGNAVKFTESGSVNLRVMPLADDQFYFEVKDTGQGIPPEKLKSIFESFQQDEEGIKKGGTGLGLAIAKQIVSVMGGELEVESEPDKGSRFFFTISLPSSKEDVRDKDDRLTRAIGLAQGHSIKTVLIDDNRDNLDVLAETLKDIGVETIEAESGLEGLEKIREANPDIIFVDYHMPGMDGLEVTKKVKEQYGEEKIKIVMISASTFDHHREMYMREGVHGFIGKPFLREEILGVMVRLLNVEYEYEEELSSEEIPTLDDIDFSSIKLSSELIKSFTDMANMGMMTELEELLPQIESGGSGGPQLSAYIKDLIEQFDTDGIIKAFEEIRNE